MCGGRYLNQLFLFSTLTQRTLGLLSGVRPYSGVANVHVDLWGLRNVGHCRLYQMKESSMKGQKAYVSSDGNNNNDLDKKVGIMMILSPAKTLDLSQFGENDETLYDTFNEQLTHPCCDTVKTSDVAKAMKLKKGPSEMSKLLKISPKLGEVAHDYWMNFDDENSKFPKKPALYAFSGAAYQGLDVASIQHDSIRYLQNNLCIIDPLYGVLRPLDQIQPYRLEMASKNILKGVPSLAQWWTESVSTFLSNSLQERDQKILLNLASDEYSAAVSKNLLPPDTKYMKVIFRQEGKVIAVHAKRARGLMVRYIAEKQINDLSGVKLFDCEGYSLVEDSKAAKDDELVFDRKKQAPNKSKRKSIDTNKNKKTTAKKKKLKS